MGKLAFNIALFSYLTASFGYFLYLIYRRPMVHTLAGATLTLGLISHTALIGIRSSQTGHGPYTTSFEIAVFFAWLIVVAYLVTEWKYKIRDLGSFVIPIVFFIMLYSAFLAKDIPIEMAGTNQAQFWMTLHRGLAIMGYSAFAVSFAVAIMYLIQEHAVKNKKLGMMYFRMPSLNVLDGLNYTIVAIGLPLYTLGFLTGSIWQNRMNEPMFQWNLATTWPLVFAWLIYCGVFFGRILVGMRGKKAAQGSVLGFVALIITFIVHI